MRNQDGGHRENSWSLRSVELRSLWDVGLEIEEEMAVTGRSRLNMKPGAALETPPHGQGKSKLEKEGESSLRPSPADRGTLPHQPPSGPA